MFKKFADNRLFVTAVMLILAAAMSLNLGCGKTTPTTTTSADPSASFPLTLVDDLGRSVTLQKIPQRIVSLAPSNTEIVYALGLGDRLVGVTEWCDYPPETAMKEKVGGYSDVNIEKVVNLNPDLILAEDIHKAEVIPALEKLGFSCYAVIPHNLTEIMASVTTIGKLTGAAAEAEAIVADMQARIDYISGKTAGLADTAKPRVLYVIWHGPLTSVGGNTPIHEMIRLAGGKSIVGDEVIGWPSLALEEVISADPQIIAANVESYPGGDAPLQAMLTEPRLSVVEAVKKSQVYGINASLTNRPVPRIIQGFEWLAAIIHPELFPEFVAEYMG